MQVRWITGFIDRPAPTVGACEEFWLAVHAATLSPRRGEAEQFATLVPPDGDAYLRMQRTADGSAASHLDLHVDDVRTSVHNALSAGASLVDDLDTLVVLRSPGGLPFCVVRHDGEGQRPAPVPLAGGSRTVVDQMCIDAAPESFDSELEFWSDVTDWPRLTSLRRDFQALERAPGMPLRILVQRRGDDAAGRATECHLDLACDDVDRAAAAHGELGATVTELRRYWTVMADPSGVRYCLTRRDPDVGMLTPEA